MAQSQQTNSQNAASPQLTLGQLGGGALSSGDIVNLFRGNLSFPLEVLSLPGRNGLNCKVNLLYQSNVQYSIDHWNLDKPTDILGMGWSLPYERIVVSAKKDGSSLDDNYYLIAQGQPQQLIPINTAWTLGQIDGETFNMLRGSAAATHQEESKGGAGESKGEELETPHEAWQRLNRLLSDNLRLAPQEGGTYLLYDDGNEQVYQLQTTDGGSTYQVSTAGQRFELQHFQYWQISYYAEYEKWEIVKEDGSIFAYGSSRLAADANTLQYGMRWNNWVGNTPQSKEAPYVTAWNLAKVTNTYGNYYKLSYNTILQTVGSEGPHYTKECYVSKVENDLGWSLQYTYGDKTYDMSALDAPKEYLDPHRDPNQLPTKPDAFQSQYNTKYLDQVALFNAQGIRITYVKFDYHDLQNLGKLAKPSDEAPSMVKLAYGATYKRYLKSITQYYQEDETKPNLQFAYNFTTDPTQNRGALTHILYPAGGVGTIQYKTIQVGTGSEEEPLGAGEHKSGAEEGKSGAEEGKEEPLGADGATEAPGARNRTISNPAGATEKDQARHWYGPNYVVSAWYNEASNTLRLNVFTWMGHWYQCSEEWFTFNKGPIDIDNLQIATSQNTFLLAINYRHSGQNEVYLFHRYALAQGHWNIQQEGDQPKAYTYDSGPLQISNGENFFLVNGKDSNDNKVIDRYAWNWFSQAWEVDALADGQLGAAGTSAYYSRYYTTAYGNYYLILCNDQSQDPPLNKFSLYYLNPIMTEDGHLNWQLGSTFETDQIDIRELGGSSYCSFAPSDSFAALAYITDYIGGSNFTRFNYQLKVLTWDDKFQALQFAPVDNVVEEDFQNIPAPILKALGPQAVDNTLVGAGPNTYYYDGSTWQHKGVGIKHNSDFPDPSTQYYWYAYTADTILKTENTDSGVYVELNHRNPNREPSDPGEAWEKIVLQDEESMQGTLRQYQAYPSLNAAYLSYGTKVYYRGVYNTWASADHPMQINEDLLLADLSTLMPQGHTINTTTFINEAPFFLAFMTVDANGAPTATHLAYLRNGDLIRDGSGIPQLATLQGQQVTTLLNKQYHYQKSLSGELPAIPMGLITYALDTSSQYSSLYTNAVTVHRYANESLQNPIDAFVVDHVEINTGYDTHHKCYDYHEPTAAQDATGEVIRFQKVKEYEGCTTKDDQQDGYQCC